MTPNSILLFVHPPFYKVGDSIFFDTQAQNGLRLWAENFDVVRVMAPLVEAPAGGPPSDAQDLQPFLDAHPTIETIMLPRRGTASFATQDLWAGRNIIREKISVSQFLVFAFSGYFGDWGTTACLIAARMGRPYAAFKDSVDHRITRILQQKEKAPLSRRLSQKFQNSFMKYRDRLVLRKSTVALLHGRDTMDYYERFTSNPHLVHDIHISKADRISQEGLDHRLSVRSQALLRVVYAGRVEEIKGPSHWVQAMTEALRQGLQINAKWYGIGTFYDLYKGKVREADLGEAVSFAGFVAHKQMLSELQNADVFVFTHMTEESPRCLIEALSAGLPLVGYDNAFARDLVGTSQAGLFVPRGDVDGLIEALKKLIEDPELLAAMALDARKIAEPLNDETVFRHRSDIIKGAL